MGTGEVPGQLVKMVVNFLGWTKFRSFQLRGVLTDLNLRSIDRFEYLLINITRGAIVNGHENSTNLLEQVFTMNLFNSIKKLRQKLALKVVWRL